MDILAACMKAQSKLHCHFIELEALQPMNQLGHPKTCLLVVYKLIVLGSKYPIKKLFDLEIYSLVLIRHSGCFDGSLMYLLTPQLAALCA